MSRSPCSSAAMRRLRRSSRGILAPLAQRPGSTLHGEPRTRARAHDSGSVGRMPSRLRRCRPTSGGRLAIAGRYAEQLGDHGDRQRVGQVAEDLDSPRVGGRVEQLVDDRWMRGRSPSMTRGVKAWLTSARSRVWSGGSSKTIARGMKLGSFGLP